MRPLLSNVPIWLCRFRRDGGSETKFIWARSAGSAAELCRVCGLGEPASVTYSGYSAEPSLATLPKGLTRRTVSLSRRAEAALAIYAALRIDWPVGSILSGFDAEKRWQASSASLRDFIANVGSILVRLGWSEQAVIADVIEAQGMSWWHAAQELNSRRQHLHLEATYHHDRKDLYYHRARRLRKQQRYSVALGEIDRGLDGLAPAAEHAAQHFAEFLVSQGLDQVDAESLVSRYRRVIVPRM
jgi:hypothetical protein